MISVSITDAQGMVDHVQPRYRNKLLKPPEATLKALPPLERTALKNGNVAARLTWAINQARYEMYCACFL